MKGRIRGQGGRISCSNIWSNILMLKIKSVNLINELDSPIFRLLRRPVLSRSCRNIGSDVAALRLTPALEAQYKYCSPQYCSSVSRTMQTDVLPMIHFLIPTHPPLLCMPIFLTGQHALDCRFDTMGARPRGAMRGAAPGRCGLGGEPRPVRLWLLMK